MEYPGNSSLSPDVHERVLNTYRQTLELAAQGNRQEASLGCDFILRLDPEFEPARTLMGRLEQGDGSVPVDDLRPGGSAFQASKAATDRALDELEHVDLEIPSAGGETGGGAENGRESGDIVAELRRLLKERRFGEVLERAQGDETLGDRPDVSAIVRTARSRLEAEPYIQSFLDSARQALRDGNREQAAKHLESARGLDASHPTLRELEGLLAGEGSPASGASPEDAGIDLEGDLEGELDDSFGSVDLSLEDSEPAVGGDERIRELLDEGQSAFEQEDYQGAIDAWSRIFLIDIDHQEAARRIEKARRLKAEHERQVEELFHEGMGALEDGNADRARELLEKVLSLQPNHLAAKESLQRIEAGDVPQPEAVPEAPTPPPAEKRPSTPRAIPMPPALADSDELSDEVLVPPEPGAARPTALPEFEIPDQSRSNRTFVYIGALVLVGVLAASWVVYQQWGNWFPNANGQPVSVRAEDPIQKATAYHDLGRSDLAIARLRGLPPNDPHFEQAQALISQWEAEAGQTAEGQGDTGGIVTAEDQEAEISEAEERSRQRELVAEARRAVARAEFLPAENLLIQARQLGELDPGTRSLEAEIKERLEPLRREIELVRGGDWEFALPDLWRLRETDPDNSDLTLLLVTSYYNLGVRDLQRGDATGAVSQFEEAMDLLEVRDPELERHLQFARAYQGRSKDLLYQIYVKYLPVRR